MIGWLFWFWAAAAPGEAQAPPVALKLLPRAGEVRLAGRPAPLGRWSAVDGGAVLLAAGAEAWLACSDGGCRALHGALEIGDGGCGPPAPPCCRREPGFETISRGIGPSAEPKAGAAAGPPAREIGAGAQTLPICGEQGLFAAVGSGLLLGGPRGAGDHWGVDPVLISPRCPEIGHAGRCEQLARPPVRLVFSEVPDATLYRAALLGSEGQPLAIAPGGLACESWPELPGVRICSHPWPADWRLPENGDTVRLIVGAQVADELRQGPASRLQQPGGAPADPLGDPPDLAAVAAWAAAGRWNELAESLRRVAEAPPWVALALADAYLHLDLPELAEARFRQAAAGAAGDDLLMAEAAVGLGLCALAEDRTEAALASFRRAADILQALGLTERREQVEDMIGRATVAADARKL